MVEAAIQELEKGKDWWTGDDNDGTAAKNKILGAMSVDKKERFKR